MRGMSNASLQDLPKASSRSVSEAVRIAELEAQARRIPELEARAGRIPELEAQIKQLSHQLEWFKRQLFGQKSEKLRPLENPDQLSLDLSGGEATPPAKTEESTDEITYSRRKARLADQVEETGLRFGPEVPVQVIERTPAQLVGLDAAEQYEVIDQRVTHRLAQRPAAYVVLEYRTPVLRHKATKRLTSQAPAAVLDGSYADVSLLAGLLVDKFCYHLPLYRQHQRLQAAGIALSRTTLTHYVQRSIDLLKPIHDAQLRNVLKSRVLAMDETPSKAGRKSKGKLQTTWYWPIYGEQDEVVFTWSQSRGSAHVQQILGDFKGTLLCDGYAAYAAYAKSRDVTRAQCWTHARRYFERARESDPAAREALEQIAALYAIEAELRDTHADPTTMLRVRAEQSRPRVDGFFDWIRQQRQRTDLVNSDPLSKALLYADQRQGQLKVYLSDPAVPMDTNHLERALRVIPMGRKNWLFSWTELGAEHNGIIQSLLVTCRLQGVDPYTYLVDVLQRIAIHPARDVEDLTPRRWKTLFAGHPMKSDLDG